MEQGICAGQNIFKLQKEYVQKKYSVHLKSLSIALSSIGNPLGINENDTIINIENTGKNEELKTLAISNEGIIKYAAFINDTDGFYQIEKAVKNRLEIPVGILKQNSLNAVIEYINKIYEKNSSGWVCQMCGYTHEGDNPPNICCVCGVGKDQFLVT
jgi:rubrerythrin